MTTQKTPVVAEVVNNEAEVVNNEAELVNSFTELNNVNVSKYVEKKEVKNKKNNTTTYLSYLSWPFAIAEIKKRDVTANWEFLEPIIYPDRTMMVHCNFTCFGITHYMWLPVLNYANQALPNPNAFDINKTMMRCLVKAIAVHGLGLYIYAGEDLPEDEKDEQMQYQANYQQQNNNYLQQNSQQQVKAKTVSALQLTPEKQKEAADRALAKIEATNDVNDLNAALEFFKGTEHEQTILNACLAKVDREGWNG